MATSRGPSRSHAYSATDIAIIEDCDNAAQGGWITAVERLVRWLKNSDCNEYAQPLSRQAKSFHQAPTDRHREQRALADISRSLDWLRSEPPTDLHAKKRKQLARLVQNAGELVKHRLEQVAEAIERDRNAKKAEQSWMDENDWGNVENDTEGNFLEALSLLQAFDAEGRVPLSDVVKKAEGPAADPDNFKQLAAKLVHKRLIDSKVGRTGGYWLTERGKAYVEQKRKV